MALYYQTEYRVGGRGRIRRSYTGLQAFVAIVFDLIFGLCFELVTTVVSLALRLVYLALQIGWIVGRKSWSTVVAIAATIVYALTFPFVLLHHALGRLRVRTSSGCDPSTSSVIKPDWAMAREV